MTSSPPVLWRKLTIQGIATLLALLHLLHLAYGVPRLRMRIAVGHEVSRGLGDAFLLAWLYVGVAGLGLAVALFAVAKDAASGNRTARNAVLAVALTFVAFAVAAYALAPSHPGLLVFALFGLALIVPVAQRSDVRSP